MTEILEEPVERKQESEAELKRRHEEAVKRGEEVVALVQKEITEIDRCKDYFVSTYNIGQAYESIVFIIIEPRHVISNNVATWQV